jgi:transcriptional regulator with XRE-family HTH domain
MTRKAQEAQKKEAQRAALRKVLQVLFLHERQAADLFGVPYSRINNITRKASRSSLDLELAHKIQAATGISADSLMAGDLVPLMLNGEPANNKSFQAWQSLEINQEAQGAQEEEIAMKAILLLKASGQKGHHLRRRTYHLLRSLLEEMRTAAGLSMTEIHEAARKRATINTFTATRKELDEKLGKAPSYQAVRNKLPAKGTIQVIEEIFPTWGDFPRELMPEVVDSFKTEANLYRLQAGGEWLSVPAFHFAFKGKASNSRAKKIFRKSGKATKPQPNQK